MPIKYALLENNITSDPDDYAAMVQISGSTDGDHPVRDIVDQGSTVNKPDILAVTAALKLACQRRVEQGQRFNYFSMGEFFPRLTWRRRPHPSWESASISTGVGTA